jgi:hypothetical protein
MIIFCFQLVTICLLNDPALTVLLLRLKLMAVIYETNSVLNSQPNRACTGCNFCVSLRGMNIVLSSHFLS